MSEDRFNVVAIHLLDESLCLLQGKFLGPPLSRVTRENLEGIAAQLDGSVHRLVDGTHNRDVKPNPHPKQPRNSS